MEKIKNIQNLYSEINYKSQFLLDCGNALGKKPSTLKNHWFSGLWSIPEQYEDKVIEILQKYIYNQKNK